MPRSARGRLVGVAGLLAGVAGLLAGVGGLLAATPARAATWTWIAEGTPLLYHRGTTAPPADWPRPGASERGFVASAAGFGIGYGDDDDRTVLRDMRGAYLTVYVRAHFTVGPERGAVRQVRLRARFDDGFAAYLNGVEIARSHLPPGRLTSTTPASCHEAANGAETFAVDPALLRDGDNVLAVEVHNCRRGSSDLSFVPTLSGDDAPGAGALLTHGPVVQQVERTGLTLCWETDVPAAARVEYGPSPALGLVAAEGTPRTRHELPLRGLPPGATCHYRITSASGAATVGRARLEPDPAAPWRLVAMGDTRSNHSAHARVIAGVVAADPGLVLNSGDLVGASTPAQWRTFFAVEAPLLARAMLLPALGNHEGDAVLYREKFVLPAGSPGGEKYYARRFAQVAVVTLDQYQSPYGAGSAQHAWLRATLAALAADPGVRFILVQLHHGPYASGPHGGNGTARRDLVPLFEQHRVAIVFSGHDHVYERSTVRGVKYVVSAGGGAPLHEARGTAVTERRRSGLHYCLLELEGATLRFRAFAPEGGEAFDEFWLGRDRRECEHDADCAGRPAAACDPPAAGAWRCVRRACVPSCGAAAPAASAPAAAAGAASAPAVVAPPAVAAPPAPPAPPAPRGRGCAAVAAPATPGRPLLALAGAVILALAPRRRGYRR